MSIKQQQFKHSQGHRPSAVKSRDGYQQQLRARGQLNYKGHHCSTHREQQVTTTCNVKQEMPVMTEMSQQYWTQIVWCQPTRLISCNPCHKPTCLSQFMADHGRLVINSVRDEACHLSVITAFKMPTLAGGVTNRLCFWLCSSIISGSPANVQV